MARGAAHKPEDPHLHRLSMLCDGVFAISLTLLSLDLRPPADWNGHDLLAAMATKLLAYALSFLIIALFWMSHRRAFLILTRADVFLDVLTLVFLGLVALLPAATAVSYEHRGPEAFRVYLQLVTVTGVVQGLGWAYAAFLGKLAAPEFPFGARVFLTVTTAVMPGAICAVTLYSGRTGNWWGWVLAGLLSAAVAIGWRLVARPAGRTPSVRRTTRAVSASKSRAGGE